MLGLGVLLEEGVGEAALEVTQEPFRFQNQPSLRREIESLLNKKVKVIYLRRGMESLLSKEVKVIY